MRISVELVLSLLAQGKTRETILDDYPGREPENIRGCAYAHAVVADRLSGNITPREVAAAAGDIPRRAPALMGFASLNPSYASPRISRGTTR
jgi:uncharacterized protein (DUF433 family)